jgi:hypothetical protein
MRKLIPLVAAALAALLPSVALATGAVAVLTATGETPAEGEAVFRPAGSVRKPDMKAFDLEYPSGGGHGLLRFRLLPR